jgi:hypothetical protein
MDTTQAAGGSQQMQEHGEVSVEDNEPPISGAQRPLNLKAQANLHTRPR